MNIGDLYLHELDQTKAIMNYEKAIQKVKMSGRPSWEATILREYAKKLATLDEDEKAAQLYAESMMKWKLSANRPAEAKTAIMVATFYAENGNKKQALAYYNHASVIWQKLGETGQIKNIEDHMKNLAN